ncbi:acyltransferase family protein [Pseudomonas sp. NPDC096917]|uniref:acyltransferase family protein n=1 Tax=Pseudomonas sp. NPDC096917 TaxID=3364483 RepID=UPI00383A93D2
MSTPKSLVGITSLRGLAATLVLVIHSFLFLGYSQPHSKNFELTNIGVDIFFVLSGFIMALAHWDDFGKGTRSVTLFLKKRFIRIYPMYFIITLCTAIILYIAPHLFYAMQYSNSLILESLLFIPSQIGTGTSLVVAVAWTLAFEVVFYIIFSICLLSPRNRGLALVISALSLWALGALTLNPTNYIEEFFLSTLPLEFICGIIICIHFKSKHNKLAINPPALIAILVIATTALIAFTIPYPMADRTLRDNSRVIYYGIPAVAIFFCFLNISQIKTNWLRATINSIGDASYSTYLTHFLVIGAIKFAAARTGAIDNVNIYILIIFSCILCTACGIATHKIIEIPATKLFRTALLKKQTKQSIPAL